MYVYTEYQKYSASPAGPVTKARPVTPVNLGFKLLGAIAEATETFAHYKQLSSIMTGKSQVAGKIQADLATSQRQLTLPTNSNEPSLVKFAMQQGSRVISTGPGIHRTMAWKPMFGVSKVSAQSPILQEPLLRSLSTPSGKETIWNLHSRINIRHIKLVVL